MDDTSYFYKINVSLSATTCAVNGSRFFTKTSVYVLYMKLFYLRGRFCISDLNEKKSRKLNEMKKFIGDFFVIFVRLL